MKILALETSTEDCSVALWNDGAVLERHESGNQHSGRILPMVRELLSEAGYSLTQLDAIAFGRGPGSFTGLRIAAGVAQGLAFGSGLPVLPISSLAALAQGADAAKVFAAIDARMNQIYLGAYVSTRQGIVELAGVENVLAPSAAPLPEGQDWVGAGNGWERYHTALSARVGEHVTTWRKGLIPRARHIGQLGAVAFQSGKALPAEQALPVYLRDEIAVKQRRS